MLQDLQKLQSQIEKLNGKVVEVSAHGVYPTKKQTKVQHVAKWQNDGNTRGVTPARFVERAEAAAGAWHEPGGEAVVDYIDGDTKSLDRFGEVIARDINNAVDRIDTRRLKHSMRHTVK